MALAQSAINTPVGIMYAVASEIGLRSLFAHKLQIPNAEANSPEEEILLRTSVQMTEYFLGQRTRFDVPLEMIGTDFQKKVWKKLLEIPYGKTISYLELAKNVGNKNASRAVGAANGKNPLWLVVPCHRVIASSGSLCGYAGGLALKKYLLDFESALASQTKVAGSANRK